MKRFGSDETLPPGPGQYPAPDSCRVRDKERELASYRSAEPRKVFEPSKKKMPAVGDYNIGNSKSISYRPL